MVCAVSVDHGTGVNGLPQHRKSGARGNRTPDLFHAMEALYQLSYSPGTPSN